MPAATAGEVLEKKHEVDIVVVAAAAMLVKKCRREEELVDESDRSMMDCASILDALPSLLSTFDLIIGDNRRLELDVYVRCGRIVGAKPQVDCTEKHTSSSLAVFRMRIIS